ncbi:DUF4386 domain-containing protein [Microbulbifer sp. VAAF005]|uniref:DUF4386 domain-containing protein n=1 Tax=Microbulbifer sp. VAAF005 TaxID=3034230 RepID=UPI0024ADD7E5|nr:DUF4386 domain-containing protein [Microbulbifer sp. VAAF005]WHI46260.1 DUF4386 domain-containing protein [Microbulbifer sp. VAAF005]
MESTQSSLKLYAKHLGAAYLIYIILGMFNSLLFKKGIYAYGVFDEVEVKFRLTQTIDIVMFIAVIWASWAQYLVTKTINKNLAFLALLFRFGEGLLGFVATVITLTVIVVLKNPEYSNVFQDAQLHTLASIFVKMSGSMWDVLLIIMGIGATIFMYLFYVSNYVPRWLVLWGIFTYMSMIIYGFSNILLLDPPQILGYFMMPGAFFEITFGLWLLIKGISAKPNKSDGVLSAQMLR